jgi:hypothetical protein
LGLDAEDARRSGIAHLLAAQRADGSWPAFLGDSEGSWATALALCTLNTTGDHAADRDKALGWLDAERGREGHWSWRRKFKTVDRNVRFDPDKYGWPWISGSASWVIPTAFSIIAIKQFTACNRSEASEKRIRLGVDMLLDRACVDGGWNSGNSVVYGVPLRPHIEATAVALLALQDERRSEVIQRSLAWLDKEAPRVHSVSSLAWCILGLLGLLKRFGVCGSSALYPVVGLLKHGMSSPEQLKRILMSSNVVVSTMSLLSHFSETEQAVCAACCTHLFVDEAHHIKARTCFEKESKMELKQEHSWRAPCARGAVEHMPNPAE